MRLLTKDLRRRLPRLAATDGQGMNALARVHFFVPGSGWDWYATEFDGRDLFFGLVRGHVIELGYFSLRELDSVRTSWGLRVERDLHWQPRTLREIEVLLEAQGHG